MLTSFSLTVNFLIHHIVPKSFRDLNFLNYLDLSHNDLRPEDVTAETFEGPYDDDAGTKSPLPLLELNLGYNE